MSRLPIKGEFLVESLQDWLKKDLVEGASSSTNFGQFFFSVSSASIGIVLVITDIGKGSQGSIFLYAALIFYLCSIIVSVVLVYPRTIRINDDTDLFLEYERQIRKIRICLVIWFSLWSLGTTSFIVSLIMK
jgi:hypothetical protein